MALTPIQYRDIMNEYDQLRQDNYRKEEARLEEIYQKIPEIRSINERIASESVNAAREMLYHPQIDQKNYLHDKIQDLVRRKRELLIMNHYSPAYLDPIYTCPDCKDSGYIGQKKCYCFEERIKDLLYKQSNLMASMKENNFRTFRMDYYSTQIPEGKMLSPRENMKQVLDKVNSYIRNFDQEADKNLLIYGNPGVGKTFLTTCIAEELIRAGKSVVYLTSYQLFEQLADHTFRHEKEIESVLPVIKDSDVLIIDDLGTEMNNAFINSQLFLCINERILNKKSTIISTNFSLKELSLTYTERISSRLIQFYTLLNVYGEDIRIKKTFSPID